MGYRRGYYKKDGTYVQGHYTKSRSKMSSNKKSNKGCSLLLLTIAFCIIIFSCSDESDCGEKKCSDFESQAEAQSVFDSDRSCYENLDTDNDNIPCENLPNKIQ